MKYSPIIVKIIGSLFVLLLFSVIFYKIVPNAVWEKVFEQMKKLSQNEKKSPFYTSSEHMEELGIEIIKLPADEEGYLHSVIEEVIKAGLRYYETGENKDIELVEGYFYKNEYERIKNDIDRIREKKEIWEENCKTPTEIPTAIFSQPRRYRDLEGRVGIISLIPVVSPDFMMSGCTQNQFHIFIFRKIDNEWRIEEIASVSFRLEVIEEGVVKSLIRETK